MTCDFPADNIGGKVTPPGHSGKHHRATKPFTASEGVDPVSGKRVLYVNTSLLDPDVAKTLTPKAVVTARVEGQPDIEVCTVAEPNGRLAVLLPKDR